MDKVIIDKVDVSGCEFCQSSPLYDIQYSCNIRGYEKDNGKHIHIKCSDNKDCYYKQLKRLQAENERLKEEKGGMQILIDNYIALTEKYRQALQEIREIVQNAPLDYPESETSLRIIDKIKEVIGVE